MKFRKKPIIVEAIQYFDCDTKHKAICNCNNGLPHIHTLEGEMRIGHKDWIIKGVKGEFYPCKPDIFEATYEPV